MRPKLLLAMAPGRTRHVFDDRLLARLGQSCDILDPAPLENFSGKAARALLQKTEILVTGWGCPFISHEMLAGMPELRLIAHAAGTVKYLLDPVVFEAGVTVTNAAEANAVPVAEFTLASIIFAGKHVFALRDRYRADPSRRSTWALMDEPIGNYRRTVGLIGASRIGRKVAALLQMLEVDVLLADPYVEETDPVARVTEITSLDDLLQRADIVSLHAPSLASTHGMIGRREFKLMRDGATFINTARGALVDEAALLAELQTGRIHAVIDVTDPEIPARDSPFFSLPNVFLTPHVAGAAGLERLRLGQMVVEEIERFVAGEPLHHAIEPTILERLA